MIYVNARFVTQPLTGVQRYAFEICMQMKRLDSNIVFLCPANATQRDWSKALDVKNIGYSRGHLWEQLDLPLYLSKQKKPVLFSPCNTGPLFLRNQFLTVHDLSFKLYPAYNTFLFRVWYNFLILRLCKRGKHIFTVSETIKKEIVKYYDVSAEKISVTFNGISDSVKPSNDIKFQKEKIVLTVGSLNDRKNTDFLIRAFMASDLRSEYKLIILGKPDSIYKREKSVVPQQVHIIVDATDEVLKNYYARAEIACFMSHYEGFGIPVLESLQYGCKVVCSDIPVYRELFGGAVYFCNPAAEQKLTGILNQLPQLNMMQQDVLQMLNKKYDYKQSAELIYKIISS